MRGGLAPKRRKHGWRSFQRTLAQGRTRKTTFRTGLKLFSLLLLVSVVCVSFLYAAKRAHRPSSQSVPATAPSKAPELKAPEPHSLPPAPPYGAVPHFEKIHDGKYVEDRDSRRMVYTIDPSLQAKITEIFRKHRPPYSAFVAIEPKTGKVLALVDYSRENPEFNVWQKSTYPAASVFKLITAAGALEKGVLQHDSSVSFRGNLYHLTPVTLTESARMDRRTHFDEALGKSNNVVFGRVAAKLLGPQTLKEYSEAFGFNHPIQFDFPIDMSRASIPNQSYELARCGAGFGDVTLNPLHAAMIAATIANGGVMMKPYLVEALHNEKGEKSYEAQNEVMGQPITPKTAQGLTQMMLRTVEDGTASKTFRRYAKPLLQKMSVCGKTGSLSGDNPPGFYDWFVGFAPAHDPQIAFAVMIIKHERWKIKGSFVAQEALKTYFREQGWEINEPVRKSRSRKKIL